MSDSAACSSSTTGLPQPIATATYDAGNRLSTRGGQILSYDANGNLASDGLTSYLWNARDQLVGLSGGVSASFWYDATERRQQRTVGTTTTRYLYDLLTVVQELSGAGTPTANLLIGFGIDETFTRTDGAAGRSLLVDALGTTLELADELGTLQTHYAFEPFGTTSRSRLINGWHRIQSLQRPCG